MSLKTYLKALSQDERETFAAACETTVGQLTQVAGGHRRAGEALAINIERESGGKVRCEDLRPDVDWAYLRNTKSRKRVA
jgi:DNA-binding transcriptional regulator YdaS (Cro superfamily)